MTSPIIEGRLWRSDYTGAKLEEITAGLLQASVQMDPDNDQTYELNAIMDYDAWLRLRPYIDWIVPELVVTWPDGTVRRGALGLYLLIDPATTRGETRAYVHLKAMDPLWLLSSQGFADDELPDNRKALLGRNKGTFVRQLLNSMVVSERATDRVRSAIPQTELRFRRPFEWPVEDNKLEVVNEVLEGMGCWPLWSSKRGVLTSREMGAVMLRMQHPVRTYIANIPEGFTVHSRLLPLGGMASEVANVIDTSPGFDDLLNTILIINDDSKLGRFYVERTVKNPQNRRAAMHPAKRKHRKSRHNKTVDDTVTAGKVATGILDKLSTFNETVRLDVMPDPEPDFAREVIDLLVWDALERRVARAKYLVHRVSYWFTPNEGTMTIECGRIDDAEGGLAVEAA